MDLENRGQKQLAKAKAWEAEFARKCQPLKAIKIGLVWECDVAMETDNRVINEHSQLLAQFAAVTLAPVPIQIGTESKGVETPTAATADYAGERTIGLNEKGMTK